MTSTIFTNASFTERDVMLSSGQLHIREGGNGRPLLHLHSAGGPRISPMLGRLAARHRLICPFAPGMEDTPALPTVKTVPALADLYAELIRKEIGDEPCDVMGESFGGYVGLWLAAKHPGLVDHLVLEGPGGLRVDGKGGWQKGDPETRQRLLYAQPDRAPKETRSAEVLAANRKTIDGYNNGNVFDSALAARLPEIKARTLIVMGYKEQVIPVETGHLLKAKIPQSHLTYIFGAAHAIAFDQPERLGQLVADFLERGESFIVRDPQAA